MPIITAYQTTFIETTVSALFFDRVVNPIEEGLDVGIRISPRILVNTNDGALEAAKRGLGLTRLISCQVASELATGTLKPVLTDFEDAALPVHVIHREGRL
jgi:hypothetical protein